ncbi:MAG: PD-(D/E)XK nuclease family protein [Planctomycetes bacterium]|nr:PD-(D/E)XK nuclease family protein [Planctomycetota bacterium]
MMACKLTRVIPHTSSLDGLIDAIDPRRPERPRDRQLVTVVPTMAIAMEVEHRLIERGISTAGVHVLTAKAILDRLARVGTGAPRHRMHSRLVEEWLQSEIRSRLEDLAFSRYRAELRYLHEHASARKVVARTLLAIRRQEAGYSSTFVPHAATSRFVASFLGPLATMIDRSSRADDAISIQRANRELRDHGFSRAFSDRVRLLVHEPVPRENVELASLLLTILQTPSLSDVLIERSAIATPIRHDDDAGASLPKVGGSARFATFHARGNRAELTEACIRIRDLIRSGTRPDRIAILMHDEARYHGLLTAIAEREDVPVAIRGKRTATSVPAIGLANGLIRLCCRDAPRSAVIAALAHPNMNRDANDAGVSSRDFLSAVAAFDDETRNAGCTGGFDALLGVVHERLSRKKHARHARAVSAIEAHLSALRELAERLRSSSTNVDQARAIDVMFAHAIAWTPQIDTTDIARIDRCIRTALEELAVRDTIALPPLDIDSIPEAFRSRLPPVALESESSGVAWLSLDEVHGRDFDAVFLLGFERGTSLREPNRSQSLQSRLDADDVEAWNRSILESRNRIDPSITPGDTDVVSLTVPATPQQLAMRVKGSLATVLATTRDLVTVSYCRADDQGRPLGPSPWIGAISEALGGSRRIHDLVADPEVHASVPWTPARRYSWRCRPGTSPSRDDALRHAGLTKGWRGLEKGVIRLGHDAPSDLLRGASWIGTNDRFEAKEPAGFRFDPWQLGPTNLASRGVSATSFTKLDTCPLQFYFAKVIGAAAMREAPTIERISSLDIGNAAHAVLEDTYRSLFAEEHDLEERIRLAKEMVAAELQKRDDEFVPPIERRYPVLGDVTRGRWRAALEAFVEADLRDLDRRGLVPGAFERALATELDLEDVHVRLTGKLDRIDYRGGAAARVIDYKTGAQVRKKPNDRNAEPKQLELYALMLEGTDGVRVAASLLGIAPRHFEEYEGELPERALSASFWDGVDAHRSELARIARPMVDGTYEPRKDTPFPCNYCDFRAACPRYHAPTLSRLGLELGT